MVAFGKKLLLLDSADRAGASASAALDALSSVDHANAVLLGDSANGASSSASAAANASLRNYVCHSENTSCL